MTAPLPAAARAGALVAAAVFFGVALAGGEELRMPSLVAVLGGAVSATALALVLVPAVLRLAGGRRAPRSPCWG